MNWHGSCDISILAASVLQVLRCLYAMTILNDIVVRGGPSELIMFVISGAIKVMGKMAQLSNNMTICNSDFKVYWVLDTRCSEYSSFLQVVCKFTDIVERMRLFISFCLL